MCAYNPISRYEWTPTMLTLGKKKTKILHYIIQASSSTSDAAAAAFGPAAASSPLLLDEGDPTGFPTF